MNALEKSNMEDTLNIHIKAFFEHKEEFEDYKHLTEIDNKKIKELMSKLDTKEFETDNGLIAKVSVQNREGFNEPALIEKLKELNMLVAIKTKEYVDMNVLEDLIYNGYVDAKDLTNCKETKQVTVLKVSKKKNDS